MIAAVQIVSYGWGSVSLMLGPTVCRCMYDLPLSLLIISSLVSVCMLYMLCILSLSLSLSASLLSSPPALSLSPHSSDSRPHLSLLLLHSRVSHVTNIIFLILPYQGLFASIFQIQEASRLCVHVYKFTFSAL